ncbi:uncharacterized protein TRIADDRAFT_55440 [Trichoplax adhaerens]|uniref:Aminotransferase class V domain-containing protein n=1 Tax=Trichoplax adhaerens TaxID=10228 RepID=B3RUW7_TRIAD|nr:hypothetical protein TRIADDRAFT_55440 [Trichoplax adhaerens]EDV25899.1 hypothetical protein TRIADDRAFT_55440 [Trichoplax adhaerens]|eukprot:XP_002111932.1 hypothetical protein TRIADDRAFT_55440 [Trichoplax adhaerens]
MDMYKPFTHEDGNEKQFGKEIRDCDFMYDPKMTFLNHGAFGGVPRPLFARRLQVLERIESNPDEFFEYLVLQTWQTAVAKVAGFVGSSPSNLTFIPNATSNGTIALQSLNLQQSDGILITNLTHESLRFSAAHFAKLTGAKLYCINFTFPLISKQDIIDKYQEMLNDTPAIKVAIIDHITSPTAVKMPIEELIKLCRTRNVKSIIDGAHAPGQVPLNLDDLQPDFYSGNMHKWGFTPRGCAIFWVHPELHDQGFQLEFFKQATRDYSPFIIAGAAVDYIDQIGGMARITEYNISLRDKAVQYILKEIKGTELLGIPEDLRSPFLTIFKIPECQSKYEKNKEGSLHLRKVLFVEHKVDVYIFALQNQLWCRFTTHIYNHFKDIIKMVEAIQKECS